MRYALLSLALALTPVPAARAQPPDEPTRLTLKPAAAPVPALKYRLLPELADTQPGNAALLYLRSLSPEWWTNLRQQKYYADISEWLDRPFKKLPPEAAFVRHFSALRELDLGARRERCDWEMTVRLKTDGFGLLVPDIQGFRESAVLLALRSRFEIADKDYRRAIDTFQTGIALGRDVGDNPTLIHALVGVAIVQLTLARVEELLQAPDAPNLYWALTDLPRPLIDLRKPLQGEKLSLEAQLPELKTIETEPLSPAAQRQLLKKLRGEWVALTGAGPEAAWHKRLGFLGIALQAYPQAKRALIAQGRKAADVAALPVVQVVLLDALQEYRRLRDDAWKWANLPPWQAQAGWEKFERALPAATKGRPHVALFAAVIPAMGKVSQAAVRLDRRVAALRTIEAIRLYAAAHGGKLPVKLTDITEVPVPDDPATGKSFLYRVDGNRVTLRDAPLANGRPALATPLHYELTFKR